MSSPQDSVGCVVSEKFKIHLHTPDKSFEHPMRAECNYQQLQMLSAASQQCVSILPHTTMWLQSIAIHTTISTKVQHKPINSSFYSFQSVRFPPSVHPLLCTYVQLYSVPNSKPSLQASIHVIIGSPAVPICPGLNQHDMVTFAMHRR